MSYTTIEQSKKLLELGVNSDSADMCYKTIDVDNAESDEDCVFDLVHRPYSEYLKYVGPMGLDYKAIPCWSTEALLQLLPKAITSKRTGYKYTFALHPGAVKKWYICYERDVEPYNERNSTITVFTDDSLVNAAYEMKLWLSENNDRIENIVWI